MKSGVIAAPLGGYTSHMIQQHFNPINVIIQRIGKMHRQMPWLIEIWLLDPAIQKREFAANEGKENNSLPTMMSDTVLVHWLYARFPFTLITAI